MRKLEPCTAPLLNNHPRIIVVPFGAGLPNMATDHAGEGGTACWGIRDWRAKRARVSPSCGTSATYACRPKNRRPMRYGQPSRVRLEGTKTDYDAMSFIFAQASASFLPSKLNVNILPLHNLRTCPTMPHDPTNFTAPSTKTLSNHHFSRRATRRVLKKGLYALPMALCRQRQISALGNQMSANTGRSDRVASAAARPYMTTRYSTLPAGASQSQNRRKSRHGCVKGLWLS